MPIHFYKYQGTGNDFVIIDNRNGKYRLSASQVKHCCDRRFGIGADGLMLLNMHPELDFEMKYYNADGGESSMCGNGGRCLVKFAHEMGIHKSSYRFMAVDGLHEAEIGTNGIVRLKMQDVNSIEESHGDCILDTGSPHYVKMISDVMEYDVFTEGRKIRYNNRFAKEGINVNFVQQKKDDEIIVRTYERGVEDETFSCGTGVTAAAIVNYHNEMGFNDVEVHTKGGKLSVEFDKTGAFSFTNIWLCGPAEKVFEGNWELK
jgi:diaminopimelate epimerase